MRAIIVLLVVLVIIAAIMTVGWLLARQVRRHVRGDLWAMDDDPLGGHIVVYLYRGKDRIHIARLDPNDDDFEYAIEEARAEGEQRLAALNRPRLRR